MFAIAVNALYTTVRRRGTTRQLAGAIVTCVIAALLLLPALVWYNMRFSIEQAAISTAEVELGLVYVALFGWFLPLSVTAAYCLFALPRTSMTSVHIPRQKRTTPAGATTALNPLRHQAGVEAPYVFSDDTPWGWLEYRSGSFQGQQLALKRSVVTIGRGEDNDIWLDDDMASRNHAELAWDKGQVYLTDCDSMNGVLLNGRRIRGTVIVTAGDLLEIGSHRLLFISVEQSGAATEQDDPLLRHIWHSAAALQRDSEEMTRTELLERGEDANKGGEQTTHILPPLHAEATAIEEQETAEMILVPGPAPADELSGVLRICSGENTGQCFSLDRALITIGRGSECNIVINDASISRVHAQILRQANGMYVQDLSSRNGTKVNDKELYAPQRLQAGDIVCVGSVQFAYSPVSNEVADPSTPMPPSFTPPPMSYPIHNSNPVPLRLPSKPKSS
ncbi:MAG: FHA domain-containing protein [Ktedonobacteraceae bacterium]